MKRVLAAAIAILATLATIALLAGLALSIDLRGKNPVRGAQAQRPPAQDVGVVSMDLPEGLLKRVPRLADSANGSRDLVSCQKVGGDWADAYAFGTLVGREPLKGAKPVGKRCWPARLADAGKACRGQADCIGNCMAEQQADGKWSGPRCQAYAEQTVCGPIFDGGRYHWVPCPVY